VRKAGNRLRVSAQLLEAETGKRVWAERYDRDLADIFVLQDEIAEAVTIAIAPAPKGTAHAQAAGELRRVGRPISAASGTWAKPILTTTLVHNDYFSGYRSRSDLCWRIHRARLGAASSRHGIHYGQFAETQTSAEALARRAVALADAQARSCFGQALRHRGDYEGVLAEAERALTTTPNLARAHGVLASALLFSGRLRDGLAAVRRSIRLDPRDPGLASRLNYTAIGLYFSREYEAAVEATKRAICSYPEFPLPYRWLAAAIGQTGRIEEARQAPEQALAITPTSFYLYVRQRVPSMRAEDHAHMLEGLRNAGWRD
jgi:adenylate cyclase